jgi:hypothetical protein
MTTLALLGAPYEYVHTEDVISHAIELLGIDQTPSGTGPTSIIIAQERQGRRSLLELRGLGKGLWKGEDAQEYVNRLRKEWEK